MNTKQSLLHKCLMLWMTLALVALCGANAQAAPVTFSVSVTTSTITGTNGFLNLQLNPADSSAELATAMVTSFAQVGGSLAATSMNTGSAVGTLPGPVSFVNDMPLNDLFQGDTFGSMFSFNVTFDGPALDSPPGTVGTVFSLSLFADADGTMPLLTMNTDGFLLQIFINPDGTTTVSNFNMGALTVSQVGQPIPEPATMLLLATGLVGVAAGLRNRRKATSSSLLPKL